MWIFLPVKFATSLLAMNLLIIMGQNKFYFYLKKMCETQPVCKTRFTLIVPTQSRCYLDIHRQWLKREIISLQGKAGLGARGQGVGF